MRAGAVALGALALALATGCSGDDGEDTAYEHSVSTLDLPACADVWVDGKTLPEDYRGCLEPSGHADMAQLRLCGGSRLTTYGDRYYAVTGRSVHVVDGGVATDPAYLALLEECPEEDPRVRP